MITLGVFRNEIGTPPLACATAGWIAQGASFVSTHGRYVKAWNASEFVRDKARDR